MAKADPWRLVESIDVGPDKLHSESTPATEALIEIGAASLPAVIPLLDAPGPETRMRARYVLEAVTMEMFGFRRGRGWPSADREQQWREFWARMPAADASSAGDGTKLASRWTGWLRGASQ